MTLSVQLKRTSHDSNAQHTCEWGMLKHNFHVLLDRSNPMMSVEILFAASDLDDTTFFQNITSSLKHSGHNQQASVEPTQHESMTHWYS
jgi:hypothetical protein